MLKQILAEVNQQALYRYDKHNRSNIFFLTGADNILDSYRSLGTLALLFLKHENVVIGSGIPYEFDQRQSFNACQREYRLYDEASMQDDTDVLRCRTNAVCRNISSAMEAFQNVNTFGTYYFLSLHLKSARYNSIHNVLSKQMRIEYQYIFPDYMQQNSHCSHNRLVQKIHHVQMKYIGNSLLQTSPWIFTLIKRLGFPLYLWIVGTAWLAGLDHLVFAQARLASFFRRSGVGQSAFPKLLPRFTAYTLVSNAAMVRGLLNSLNKRKRKVW